MKKRLSVLLVLAVATALTATTVFAGIPKPERKQIRQALKDTTLYLKVDAPCVTGRHPFGVYYSPLVEVSPDGVNTEEHQGGFGMYHADSAYWGIQVNDPVRFDDVEFDGDTFEVELVGVKEAEDEITVIKFHRVNSYDDFRRAFDHVFSTEPLQYLHDDWSEEVKTAIGDRRLMEGMSKRQTYYVTGAPKSFERWEEDGVEVEVWTLRENRGMKMGFFRMNLQEVPSGLPEELRFEDGRLVNVVGKGTGSELSLD